jgi:hypothetical protein
MKSCSRSLFAIAAICLPVFAAPTPKLDHIAPALFEIEPNARYVSTDMNQWEVFTRTGVQLGRAVAVEFISPDRRMMLEGMDRSGPTLSVYQGNDSSKWKVECPSFGAVAYRGLYPGIDLVYRRTEGRLKGDFIVQPGVDPGRIRFRLSGGTVELESGRIRIHAGNETLEERMPAVYDVDGEDRQIARGARYLQYPDGSIGFEVAGHDPRLKLVIDPELTFSTFVEGTLLEQITAVTYSPFDKTWLVGGWTESTNLLSPPGGLLHKGQGGSTDGFFGRFSVASSGTLTLSSMTIIGGTGNDKITSIGTSAAGNVVLGGSTTSTNFPVSTSPAAYQKTLRGTTNGFIVELATNLYFATYFGGTGSDQINGVAVDSNYVVYFAGTTTSTNLPVVRAVQSTFKGGQSDGFVGTLLPSLTLGYCTYLGGSNDDSIAALSMLGGEVYLTGATSSFDFPTKNPFQANTGGGQDAFVTKLTVSGTLSYSSFLGGSGGTTASPEMGTAITVDSAGEAYVVGMTSSTNFPTNSGAQATFGGGATDAFLVKVAASGLTRIFSTYWGGSDWDQANAVTILPSGFVAISGATTSFDYPILQPLPTGAVNSGAYDAFAAVFSPTGTLYWSTYFGGSGTDAVYGMGSNAKGELLIGGLTASFNLPLVNPLQSTINSSGYHGFLARLSPTQQFGTFRPSSGQFFLSSSHNFVKDTPVFTYSTLNWGNVSGPDAIPVVGDWDNTGRTRIGLFRKSTGTWYLDMNGDDLFTPGIDKVVTGFGANALPVVGDWDNTGNTRLGFYVGGWFYLDINGDNVFTPGVDWAKPFGVSTDIPIVGDWTNTGYTRVGIFRGGLWYLDLIGNFDSFQPISAIAGAGTDNPVFADWDNTGVKRIGNYRTFGYPIGWWFVDINDDFRYSGAPIDAYYIFGGTNDVAVVGVRSH